MDGSRNSLGLGMLSAANRFCRLGLELNQTRWNGWADAANAAKDHMLRFKAKLSWLIQTVTAVLTVAPKTLKTKPESMLHGRCFTCC